MTQTELEPCPFCGGGEQIALPPTCAKQDAYDPADRAFPVVRCKCGAEVPGKDWDYSMDCESAITAWNTRETRKE